MAYNPTNWENREVERPRTYTITENADGTVTLTPSEGQVFSAGTPIIAENMNNIENQLVLTDEHINDDTNPHGVTAGQVGAYTKAESDSRFETKGIAYPKGTSDSRYAYKDASYTKSEADNRFEPKIAKSEGVQLYVRGTRSYTANGWRNIFFEYQKNSSSGLDTTNGYVVTVNVSGYYAISCAVSISNMSISTGYAVMRVKTGSDEWRFDGKHYTSTENLSLSGSTIDFLSAGDEIRVYIFSNANFDVVGASDELKAYLNIRQLL